VKWHSFRQKDDDDDCGHTTDEESVSTSTAREFLGEYMSDGASDEGGHEFLGDMPDDGSDEGGHELLQGCAMRYISLEMGVTEIITLQLETIYILISERSSKCIGLGIGFQRRLPMNSYQFSNR
jgi:hypothetical protein